MYELITSFNQGIMQAANSLLFGLIVMKLYNYFTRAK